MSQHNLTIGRLARAAAVGVETVRYYQRRHLLPLPEAAGSTFRHYPAAMVERIRFIKRAQELGFSLDEIATLLQLEQGAERDAIREVASDKRRQIREKIADLQRMEGVLSQLIDACAASGQAEPCPIIAALAGQAAAEHCSRKT
jgi:Hg(II)-responsive transcriptional regulator